MVIWRGWGILALLFIPLGAFGIAWVVSVVGGAGGEQRSWSIGTGLLIAAAGLFALGWWLNMIRADAKAAQWADRRAAALEAAVEGGYFQASPGISPTSLPQARQQAATLLEREMQVARKAYRNQHTMFWIPMHWWSIGLLAMSVLTFTGAMPISSS